MAYSEYLAERVRQRLKLANVTDQKKMMDGLIFMVNDKMCIGIDMDKTTQTDRLMVRGRQGRPRSVDLQKRQPGNEFYRKGNARLFIYRS